MISLVCFPWINRFQIHQFNSVNSEKHMEIKIERAFVCLKLKRSQRLTVVEGSFGLSFVAERRQSDEIRETRKSV